TIEANSVEAYGLGNLSVYGNGFNLDLGYELHMLNGVLSVDNNNTAADMTFNPGTVVNLHGRASGSGDIDWSVGGSSGADFYHTSTTLIDVLTPGGGYTSESGHIYVPAPPPKYVQAANAATWIPGGKGTFTSLPGAPGYSSSGQVAFYGTGYSSQQGIYRGIPGNPI